MSEIKDTQQHPKVEIAVENFGPIAEANIDLRPLTVFVGPSNTGKTYFATLVYALHGVFSGFSGQVLLDPLKAGWFLEIGKRIQHKLSTDIPSPDEEILDVFTKLMRLENSFRLSDVPTRFSLPTTRYRRGYTFKPNFVDGIRTCAACSISAGSRPPW